MGVDGLWKLLDPLGRPVNLEGLENKVLAVDASILLHQSIHGFRDGQGNPLSNAHLLGLFHRITKLLFYNIKPIFVFDGAVPMIKRHTMALRRERQENAVRGTEKTHRQILTKYMQSKAVKEVLKSKTSKPTLETSDKQLSTSNIGVASTSGTADLFELPPIPPQLLEDNRDSDDERSGWENSRLESDYQNLEAIDFDSEDFKSLPLEIQHEYLIELRERLKFKSFKGDELPKDADKIGSFQIQQLLTRRKIRKRLDDVKKELDANVTGAIITSMDDGVLGNISEDRFSVARRIVSEDFAHYLLFKNIRGSTNKSDMKQEIIEKDKEIQELDEKVPDSKPPHLKIKEKISFKIVSNNSKFNDEHFVDDDVSIIDDEAPIDVKKQEADIATWMSLSNEFSSNHVELAATVKENAFIVEETKKCEPVVEETKKIDVTVEEIKNIEPIIEEIKIIQPIIEETRNVEVSGEEMVKKVENESNVAAKDIEVIIINDNINHHRTSFLKPKENEISELLKRKQDFNLKDAIEDHQLPRKQEPDTVEIESSEDEFLEVSVDVNKATEDELFPLSIFEVANEEKESVEVSLIPDVVEPRNEPQNSAVDTVFSDLLLNHFQSREELQSISQELDVELKNLVQEKGRQERIAATLTDQMYLEGQELLRQFGVPFVISPAEAEAQCATLEMLGLTQGTITDDSDVWLFGAKCVYKNFFEKGKDPLLFCDSDISERFNLNRSRLIAIAFLTGSDYTEGVKGLGVVKGLELLAEFPEDDGYESLRKFRKWWDNAQNQKVAPNETKVKQFLRKIELKDNFPSEAVLKAYVEPLVDTSTETFSWSTPDLDALREFASIKLHWSREKADSLLLPIMKRSANKEKQCKLTQFGITSLTRDNESISHRSKRLVRALKKVKDSSKDTTGDSETKSKKIPQQVLRKSSKKKTALPKSQNQPRVRNVTAKPKLSTIAHGSKDLELSESSDSSVEQNIDEVVVPRKRKR